MGKERPLDCAALVGRKANRQKEKKSEAPKGARYTVSRRGPLEVALGRRRFYELRDYPKSRQTVGLRTILSTSPGNVLSADGPGDGTVSGHTRVPAGRSTNR